MKVRDLFKEVRYMRRIFNVSGEKDMDVKMLHFQSLVGHLLILQVADHFCPTWKRNDFGYTANLV